MRMVEEMAATVQPSEVCCYAYQAQYGQSISSEPGQSELETDIC